MTVPLRPFQRKSVDFLLEHPRGLLFDETGLGKTRTSLAITNELGIEEALVSTIKVAISIWEDEVAEFFPDYSTHLFIGDKDQRMRGLMEFMVADGPKILIVNHHLLDEVRKYRDHWPILVVDEAHNLKNHKTNLFETVNAFKVPRLILATGTPESNGPVDLWSYVNLCDPKLSGEFWPWVKRHCETWKDENGFHIGGPKRPEYTRSIMAKVMVRHLKKDVAPELTKSRPRIKLWMTPKQRNMYTDLAADYFLDGQSSNGDNDHFLLVDNPAEMSTRFRQLLISPECLGFEGESGILQGVGEFIGNFYAPLVVFTAFEESIPYLASCIPKNRKIDKWVIHGGMKKEKLDERIQAFEQSDNPSRVLFATIKLSAGYSIHSASDCLFVNPEWDPSLNYQAEERLSRLGNDNHLTCYYVDVPGTVFSNIYDVLTGKKRWQDLVTNFRELVMPGNVYSQV